jgi:hypothetical protein
MSNSVHVLLPRTAVDHLNEWADVHETLGEWHLAGEVSTALGHTFNWAGHEIPCDEWVPQWAVLTVNKFDFLLPGWGYVFSQYACYVPVDK